MPRTSPLLRNGDLRKPICATEGRRRGADRRGGHPAGARPSADEIVSAIRASAGGECVISPHVAGHLLDRIRQRDIPVTARSEHAAAAIRALLTHRELEILGRLPSGRSNQEIGRELSLSENTVKNHIASILTKLQLDNRIQAAVEAVRSGIS